MLLFIIETKRRLVFLGVMGMVLAFSLGWLLSRRVYAAAAPIDCVCRGGVER
jgi:hypothetical protein